MSITTLATYQQSGLPAKPDDLAKFILLAPEKVKAMQAEIRAIRKAQLAKGVYDQKKAELDRLRELMLLAYQRMGEITNEIPKSAGGRPSKKTIRASANSFEKPKKQTIQIEFFRQFDSTAADRYAQYRKDFYARKAEKERVKDLERQAAEKAKQAKEQAELAAEKARYFGWVDGMTPLRFGQVSVLMNSSIRVEGKIMTRREFIINWVKDSWVPQKKDGVTSWYKRGGEVKESKPKTEYQLYKNGFVYGISKTEYDFAVYLVEHNAAADA